MKQTAQSYLLYQLQKQQLQYLQVVLTQPTLLVFQTTQQQVIL